MKRICPRTLLFIGVLLIFTPMVIQGINSAHDKERAADFYRNRPNTPLPEVLEPTGFDGYHWACFGIGVSLVFSGIRESKLACSVKSEKWEMAEV